MKLEYTMLTSHFTRVVVLDQIKIVSKFKKKKDNSGKCMIKVIYPGICSSVESLSGCVYNGKGYKEGLFEHFCFYFRMFNTR